MSFYKILNVECYFSIIEMLLYILLMFKLTFV